MIWLLGTVSSRRTPAPPAQHRSVLSLCFREDTSYMLLTDQETRRVNVGKFPQCLWPRYLPPRGTGLGLNGTGSLPFRLTWLCSHRPGGYSAGRAVTRTARLFVRLLQLRAGPTAGAPGCRERRRETPAAGSALLPGSPFSNLPSAFLKGQEGRN